MRIVTSIALTGCLCSVLVGQQQPHEPWSRIRELFLVGQGLEINEAPGKCATPLVFDIDRQWSRLPLQMRTAIGALLQRPLAQKSRLSPSGRFRIRYDTTTVHQPAMLSGGSPVPNSYEEYVDSVASVFDQVWVQEIVNLGFGQPPSDGGNGGFGTEYDVYIKDMPTFGLPGTFGYTEWTGEAQAEAGDRERFASFIVIENDFWGYRTPGLAGMRVTAAHEFHHAIQVGAYGIWKTIANSDFYFYEITSTWLEDALFTDVDDYLFDLPQFFQQYKTGQISYPFTEYSSGRAGYERVVWAHFLVRRFGRDIMRQIWEEVRVRPVLRAQNVVLQGSGSSLPSAFGEFTAWNFYTADRADTIRYYPEGRRYPRFAPNITVTHAGGVSMISTSAPPLSSQHYQFFLQGDTITAIVSNSDFEGAYYNLSQRPVFTLALGGADPPGADQHLSNGLTIGFNTSNYDLWRTLYLGSLTKEDLKTGLHPFPNPVRLSRSDALYLPVEDVNATSAEVFILSASLDLAMTGRYPVSDFFGTRMVSLPAGVLNSRVSSGIHFVVLKTSTKEYRWKVAIVR